MISERKETDLTMVVSSDMAGQLRGKAMPHSARSERATTGLGWTPTNTFITSFGPIAESPWGALGDLILRPDYTTHVDIQVPEYGVDENFVIGNIFNFDQTRWTCCLRGQLMQALEDLREQHGLVVTAAFEHEFHYSGCEGQPGLGYSLRALRRLGEFPNRLTEILAVAGLVPDTFMPEYGPGQCEMTIKPNGALRAADDAVILRELTRSVARGMGANASFAPMMDPAGVGNGVHIHFSLQDLDGNPVNFDDAQPQGVSKSAGSFIAGMLRHMPDYLCMTAPSVASYYRLTPHRWSAAFNNFGLQDREAAVRICPVFPDADGADYQRKFHFEFRAGDGAASPYLALAALIRSGMSGLEEELTTPQVTAADLTTLDGDTLAEKQIVRLPQSLDSALDLLAASPWAKDAFGETFVEAYLAHKRCESAIMADLSPEEICAKYARAY